MEDLNKTQILLLTLMTSFVTSIATGIITVAMMDEQAPVGVTQTVNRVVERTIERVVPEKGQSAGVITKEIVVREENLITDAIDTVSKSVVRIKERTASAGSESPTIAIGTIVSSDGSIVSDASLVKKSTTYIATYADGKEEEVEASVYEGGLVIMKPKEGSVPTLPAVNISNSDNVKMGQTALMIYGQDRNIVSMGIISAGKKNEEGNYESFDSTLDSARVYGGPVFNIQGELIGIQLGSEAGTYITASRGITSALAPSPAI